MTLRTILLHRLPGIIPLLFLTSVLSFGLVQLSPSDPAEVALRLNDITPTPEVIAETRARLGLDQPLPIRYFRWLDAVLHGDLGTSYVNGKAVTAELRQALPPTAMLAATAAVIMLAGSLLTALPGVLEIQARLGHPLCGAQPRDRPRTARPRRRHRHQPAPRPTLLLFGQEPRNEGHPRHHLPRHAPRFAAGHLLPVLQSPLRPLRGHQQPDPLRPAHSGV